MKSFKHPVFWPPFLLLLVAAIVSFTNKEAFISHGHWYEQLGDCQSWMAI
ncbi:hypothetical protein [Guptibacillus hwajinpoensis]|nr:hypothetical protein [Pseudalkalibacillus hwajinpoensis]WLR59279.1 hypothetical protein LC071_19395 [Pseudalkalibacillus hwajinpoensis]